MTRDFRTQWNHLTQLRLEIGLPHPTYPNLIRNPNGVLGAWGWLSPKPNTVIDGYGPGAVGGYPDGVLKFSTGSISAATAMNIYSESYPVQPGQYVGSRVVGAVITASTFTLTVEFLAADNSTVVGTSATSGAVASGPRVTPGVVVPATAAFARLKIDVQRATTGTRDLYFGYASLHRADVGADVTAALATFRDTVDTWVNVIAPTHSIDVDRSELDVGTLSARVLDATLDPAVAATIRPGRPVRLMVANVFTWEPLFTGTLLDVDVKYDLIRAARGDNNHAQISLTAVDNVTVLARRRMSLCVAEIPHLRTLLEGSGVPWNVNGSRQQLGDVVPVVSISENATVLDQVVTTRDSKAGFAWVDRRGVLNVADKATADQVFFGLQNLIGNNPSLEVDATTWAANAGAVARVIDATAPDGIAVGRYTSNGTHIAGQTAFYNNPAGAAIAGRTYTGSIWLKNTGTTANMRPRLYWYTGPTNIGSTLGTTVAASALTDWARVHVTGVAPAGADGVRIGIDPTSAMPAAAEVRFDAAMITESPEPVAYFAGSVQQSFSERQYSNLDLAFSSKHLINEVNVKSIEWDPANPSKSIEVPYGPYRDQDSAMEWGVASREFTVTGLNLAAIQALALTILLRNKTPRVIATEMSLPILTQDHITKRALIDLYNLIAVEYEPKRFNDVLRVTGIRHSIDERGWVMRLAFAPGSASQTPQATPALRR